MATVTLAEYLFIRLRQLGVTAVHGVPGDFNLTLLDYVEPAGLQWVGNANELNAGYAADGYARIKGLGAIVTTFGVGELSAINAIAGAYVERTPVVHIVGTPGRPYQDSRTWVHHTFADADYGRFAAMQAHVTAAQAVLKNPHTAPGQIDATLIQCLVQSRPVYISIPVDLVDAPIPAELLSSEIKLPVDLPTPATDSVIAKMLEAIYAAKQPLILVDGEIVALGIVEDARSFVKLTGWPTWVSTFAKGLVDESLPNFHGINHGNFDDPSVQEFIKGSDLIVCFGPHFSSTNTALFSSRPAPAVMLSISDTEVKLGDQIFRDIPAKIAASSLLRGLDAAKLKRYEPYPQLRRDYLVSLSDVSNTEPISHAKLWRILASFLRPGDIVFGETGTAGYGCREMLLPAQVDLFTPVTWLSIGYMLPAAQGAALAQRDLIKSSQYHGLKDGRVLLFIGDGSFQMTAQELGTIVQHNLNVMVFLMNNDGYTIERCIHGKDQRYNGVPKWNYLQAPGFFGAPKDSYTNTIRTYGDLEATLSDPKFTDGEGLRMVEVMMDRDDAPAGALTALMDKQKAP